MSESNDRDLVPVTPAGARERRVLGLCVAAFLATLLATAAVDLVAPREATPLGPERRMLRNLRTNATWTDGSEMRRIEYERKLRSRARAELGSAYAALRLLVLGEAKSQVVVGDDRWLFMADRAEVPDDAEGRGIARGVALYRSFQRRHASVGTKLVAVPVPQKASAVSEMLGRSSAELDAWVDRAIEAYARPPFPCVDVRPALASFDPDERWLHHDTHWSYVARVLVAKHIVQSAGRLVDAPTSTLVDEPCDPVPTDLLRFTGIADGSLARAAVSIREVTIPTLENAPERMAPVKLALCGTSFSSELAAYLSHWAGEHVHDGAVPSSKYLESLAQLVLHDDVVPELVWVEFPLNMLRGLGRREARLNAEQGASIGALPIVDVTPLDVATRTPGDKTTIVIAGGLIADAGLASVRLAGGESAKSSIWRVKCDGTVADVPWLPMRDVVLIPVLDTDVLGDLVRVDRVRARGDTSSVVLDVVTDLDVAAGVEGALADVPKPAAAEFGGRTIETFDGIAAVLRVAGAPTKVRIRATTVSGRTVTWDAHARDGATVLLDLSDLVGESLERVDCGALDGETRVWWRHCTHAPQHETPRS